LLDEQLVQTLVCGEDADGGLKVCIELVHL
jgi:hypothetical protein